MMIIWLMTIKPLSSEFHRLEYALITWSDVFHFQIFGPAFDLISGIFKTLNNADFISFNNGDTFSQDTNINKLRMSKFMLIKK